MGDVLGLSATALAVAIRRRELTSREVVERHIERIGAVNPSIRAVVATRYEEARREADAADTRVRASEGEELPPFLGVPCTIKEAFLVTGMPNSAGLVARRDVRADRDAPTVARLRAAGAIVLGVTNVSELCMWIESANRVYGRTRNPYDVRRTAGGSSGGEGAIIGAGGSPFGLGSDVGGSIRLPAYFNGVFGHKPTGGLVPNTGQFPAGPAAGMRLLATGLLVRRAEDLCPLLRILAGPDGEDGVCVDIQLGDPAAVNFANLKIANIPSDERVSVAPELQQAQSRAAAHLRGLGAVVRDVRVRELRHAFEIWSAMMRTAGGATFAALLGTRDTRGSLRALGGWMLGRSPHTLPAIGLALLEGIPQRATGRMVELGAELRARLLEVMGRDGVLLYPSYGVVAPRHGRAMVPPFRWPYAALFNALEMPVTQVPLGLGREGLPLGVQVVAAHGQDHRTIAVALELERAFGGWVRPRL